jgi:pimeloyl-ACP methyl ester carboxylesterase
MIKIESLLSARLFVAPQLAKGRLYFLSNLSGHLSLYAMDAKPGGGVPEPLLPPHLALQNPELEGNVFKVFPRLNKILVMLDHDGDENYQPMLIPLTGGYPELAFGDQLAGKRVHCVHYDLQRNIAYFAADAHGENIITGYQGNLKTGELKKIAESEYGAFVAGANDDHSQLIWAEGYTAGDTVFFQWNKKTSESKLLAGVPLAQRKEGEAVKLTAFGACYFTPKNRGLIFTTALFSDSYSLGYLSFADPQNIQPVKVTGIRHKGTGEMINLRHLKGNRYALDYNIDGVSWLYEGAFDEKALKFTLDRVICGKNLISNGVMAGAEYDEDSDTWAVAYSTATAPTQIYTVSGKDRKKIIRHTNERVLGIHPTLLAAGEDASFTSHDGLRVSARLYLPAPSLKFEGPRPVVYYIHGGPQGQERPDFAWFSMPLIQFLTLNGFAVFVPNARGSTGYGLSYMKHVDHDWGGQDRLDHVYAMTKVLPDDKRLDVKRAAVVGRSYGGYMTLTMASRHPELWSAAVDMFGPYDLLVWVTRLPETWKTYFNIALGHPEKDRDFLIERSPSTHIGNITAPLLVIQGKNDPRVVEQESRDVVEKLRAQGKEVEYLMFENEGHDVLKFENRVTCYGTITEFFKKHLRP